MTKVIKVPESHLEVICSPQQEPQPTALSQPSVIGKTENCQHCPLQARTQLQATRPKTYLTYRMARLSAVSSPLNCSMKPDTDSGWA